MILCTIIIKKKKRLRKEIYNLKNIDYYHNQERKIKIQFHWENFPILRSFKLRFQTASFKKTFEPPVRKFMLYGLFFYGLSFPTWWKKRGKMNRARNSVKKTDLLILLGYIIIFLKDRQKSIFLSSFCVYSLKKKKEFSGNIIL